MNRRLQWMVGALIAGLLLFSLGAWAWLRTHETRRFRQPHSVRTAAGTNYVAQFVDTTLGRADSNYLVVVHLRLQNPNPFPLRLSRRWFVMVDHDKDYYLPSVTGTQDEWIELPAGGVADRVPLSYAVPPDTFAGVLAIELGRYNWVMLKTPTPYEPALDDGEFRTFARREW